MNPLTGIVRDIRFLEHRPPPGHPESPERLEAVYAMLDEPDLSGTFLEIPPHAAGPAELGWVHSEDYIRWVAGACHPSVDRLSADTYVSAGSYATACLAASGVCAAVAAVVSGTVRNAFSLVRPPGHHAERSRAMGYCLFNNVALGARFAQRVLGLRRILIVDWDVHHGNGTQHIFERDPSVLFFSVHQWPHYPGTGPHTDVGLAAGEGFSVNVPVPKGFGDAEYAVIFETLLPPLATEFAPELILVSAGFDSHQADRMGGMALTPAGFAALTRCLKETAEALCAGRLALALEGGYEPGALRESVKAALLELRAAAPRHPRPRPTSARTDKLRSIVQRSLQVHGRYWRCFSQAEARRLLASI